MMRLKHIPAVAMAVGVGLCLAQGAQAAERITLANGFDVVCDHHAVVDGKVRMYPRPAAPDYIELPAKAIVAVEAAPDAAPEPSPNSTLDSTPEAAAGAKRGGRTPAFAAVSGETKLTPADLHQLLSKAGTEHNVDEDLLASVVETESGGQVRARSRAGAQGLMQLMPGTARQLGVADSFSPDENVRGGTAYLDALLTRYHDNVALALAAYNAGPEAVDRYHGIPPYRETRKYVACVIHEFNRRVMARRKAQHDVAFTTNGTR